MSAKYTVFVSSTYTDLRDERDQVIKAVLEMGHIPVGMEMFSAADDQQWKIITNQIDQCDYYVVVVAHKYGSTIDGVSYTEKEYDYAVAQGVPALGFVIEGGARWPQDRVEADQEKRAALERFKSKVKQKPVGFWSSGEELHGKCSIALMKAMTTNPRPGWIRATEGAGPDVLRELSRLSAENASLRDTLAAHQASEAVEAEREMDQLINAMKSSAQSFSFWSANAKDWESSLLPTNLFEIFSIVVKEASDEAGMQEIARALAFGVAGAQQVRSRWPIPSNHLKRWLLDLQSLGLVEPSVRKRSVKDKETYWTTTELGNRVYARIRRRALLGKDAS